MIEIGVRAHYRGASPLSLLPSLSLDIRSDPSSLQQLLQRRALMVPLLEASLQGRIKDQMLQLLHDDIDLTPEAWLRDWLICLCALVGAIQLEPASSSMKRGHTQPGGRPLLVCRVRLNCHADALSELNTLLRWSIRVWEQCLNGRLGAADDSELKLDPPRRDQREKGSFRAVARALVERQQFFEPITRAHFTLMRVGTGRRQRSISQKVSSTTSAFGLTIAKNKLLTKQVLAEHLLPVAPGFVVRNLEDALARLERFGYPVVSKPVAADQGVGVVTGIVDRQAFQAAWQNSSGHGQGVLVERHVSGRDFRFLLVKGRLLSALERIPAGVVGDGRHTVCDLVELENERRRRQPIQVEGDEKISLVPLELDGEAEVMLHRQGLTAELVPACGQVVSLRFGANFGLGGTVRECRAELHPANLQMLEKVAAVLQLDVIGVDVLAPSMSEPLSENGGVICEVNGMPGVLPHMLAEPRRRVMAEVVERLLPPSMTVPLVAVLSPAPAGLLEAMEAEVLPQQPGLIISSATGLRQGGHLLAPARGSRFRQHWVAIHDPTAAAVIVELEPDDLLRHGLIWPWLDLLLVPRSLPDSLPPTWQDWLCERAARVLRFDPADNVETIWHAARDPVLDCLLERHS